MANFSSIRYNNNGEGFNASVLNRPVRDLVAILETDFVPVLDGLGSMATETASDYVLRTRSISTGSGLSGGGNLTSNRTLSVDSTVLRTTGDQTKTGTMTLQSSAYADALTLRNSSNGGSAARYTNSAGQLGIAGYESNGNFVIRFGAGDSPNIGFTFGTNGYLTATRFVGSGAGLTSIPAGNLTGSVADARLPKSGNWDTAYDRSITAISGSGNGTFTITRQGANLSTNLSHTHPASQVTGLGSVATSNDYGDLDNLPSLNISNWNTAFGWGNHASVGYALASRQIVAGNGMTGGGNLTANRTVTLGTPSVITGTSTNSVTTSSHTHALDIDWEDVGTAATGRSFLGVLESGTGAGQIRTNSQLDARFLQSGDLSSYAAKSTQVIAGNGISGGGNLEQSRTLTLGTPSAITATSTNSVTASSHTHAITLTAADVGAAPTGRSIAAGNGLSGGGSLASNRTITMGTPSTITNSTTNAVTTDSHTHALSLTIGDLGGVPTSRSVSVGNGLTGGGSLASNRTITMGTPSTISMSSANATTADSHTHELNLSASDLGAAPSARTISAGNGLTGGGSLASNRTIALGTPSTITNSTTNSVSGSTHTHTLSISASDLGLRTNEQNDARYSQTDTNTTYSAGSGLNLSGTTFSLSGDSFNSSGNYANLRARGTTAADVGALARSETTAYGRGLIAASSTIAARDHLEVAPNTRNILAGTGLSGGGNLTQDRALSLDTSYTDGRYVMLRQSSSNSYPATLDGGLKTFRNGASGSTDLGQFPVGISCVERDQRSGWVLATSITGGSMYFQSYRDDWLWPRMLWDSENLKNPASLSTTNTFTARQNFQNNTASQLDVSRTDTGAVRIRYINSGGTRGQTLFDNSGTFSLQSASSSNMMTVSSSGNVVASGNINASGYIRPSDENLKDDITDYGTIDIKSIKEKIKLVKWVWKNSSAVAESKHGKADSGVIAQRVQEVFPECVTRTDDGHLGVDEGKLALHLVMQLINELGD